MRKTLFTAAERDALREATYAADREARRHAEHAWASLVRYVKQHEDDLDPLQIGRFHGFDVKGPKAGLPGWLRVAFMPQSPTTKGSMGRAGKESVIILYGTSLDPEWPTGIADALDMPSVKATFVHEFTHYRDRLRRKGKERLTGSTVSNAKRAQQRGDLGAYYRTPGEFNAHFQATAHKIETAIMAQVEKASLGRTMKKVVRREMAELFASFPKFHAAISQGYKPMAQAVREVESALKGSKWERKWLKRMHGLYRGLKSKVDKAMED
jgi:hypothetical protein